MAKLFLGLAIAIMLATAVLGFLAKGNIDKLQSSVKETKSSLARSEASIGRAKSEAEKAREEVAAATSKVDAAVAEATTARKDKETAVAEAAEAKTMLDAKNARLVALEEQLKGMSTTTGTGTEDVGGQIREMQNQLAKAQADAAEKTAMVDELNRRSQEKETQLAAAQKEVKRYQENVTRSGLTGRILAVNPGWNFVVLSVGDRQGAMVGGVMLVTRSGEPIARARITSVEPATSIADVIPGSLRKGVTVQPGDGVIFEGSRGTRPNNLAAPAPAGGAAVGAGAGGAGALPAQ